MCFIVPGTTNRSLKRDKKEIEKLELDIKNIEIMQKKGRKQEQRNKD